MSHVCVHLIGSNAVKLFHPAAKKLSAQWKDIAFLDEKSSLESVIANAKEVFTVITRNIKTFVLVNIFHYPAEYVNAVVDLARVHAIEVVVISSLQARILYALDQISARKDNERTLVVCAFDGCLDVALVVGDVVQDHCYTTTISEIHTALKQQQKLTKASRVVILSTKHNESACMATKKHLEGAVVIGVFLEAMMYEGALLRALQTKPLVRDFAEGVVVETLVGNTIQKRNLIARGSPFPVSAHLMLSDISAIKVRSIDTLIIPPRKAFKVANVYMYPKLICTSCELRVSIAVGGTDIKFGLRDTSHLPKLASAVPASVPAPAAKPTVKKPAPKPQPAKSQSTDINFIIKLRAGYGSIWMDLGDDALTALTNPMGETWTCDYISINSDPQIGPAGKLDARKHPESAVYDLHKFVGLKYKKVKADPAVKYLKFEIHPESEEGLDSTSVYDEGPGCMFELVMRGEPRLISPTTCLAMYFMALKRLASDKLSVTIDRVAIHLNKGDYKVDQIPAVEEAAKVANMTPTEVQIVDIV